MKTTLRMVPAGIMALLIIANGWSWAATAQPPAPDTSDNKFHIVPTPKKITWLEGQVDLLVDNEPCAVIVVGKSKQCRIAAEEINKHVQRLTRNSLPISNDAPENRGLTNVNLILVGGPEENELTRKICVEKQIEVSKNQPGAQGYVIRSERDAGGKDIVLLAGSDSVGTLYAGITFVQMLERDGDGLTVSRAAIDDWPDFKNRLVSEFTAWRSVAQGLVGKDELYSYIDHCLKYKINLLHGSTYFHARKKFLTPPGPDYKKLVEYAAERGIGFLMDQHTNVGFDDERNDPDLAPDKVVWCQGFAFSWARDDLLKKQAEAIASVMKENNFQWVWLHPVDRENELWERRGHADKQMYKDNERWKASAKVYNLFYNAIRKENPEAHIVFIYMPYTPPDVFFSWDKYGYHHYARKMDELTPKDVLVCTREARRHEVEEMRNQFNRPLFSWYEYGPPTYSQDYFLSGPRFFKTFFFNDGREAIFWLPRSYSSIVTTLCAAEFAWNVEAPGSAFLDRRAQQEIVYDFLEDGVNPKEVTEDFVRTACISIWGPEVGPYMAPIFNQNLKPLFINDPEERVKKVNRHHARIGRPNIDVVDFMYTQWKGFARAKASIDQAMALDARADVKMNLIAEKHFVYFYKSVSMLDKVAEQNYYYCRARQLTVQGKHPEAREFIDEALAVNEGMMDYWHEISGQVKGRPMVLPRERYFNDYGLFMERHPVNFDALKDRFEKLMKSGPAQ